MIYFPSVRFAKKYKEEFYVKPYDAIFVFNPNTSEERISSIVTKVEDKIRARGGEITKTEKWGVRRLAYSPKKFKNVKEGYYVAIFFRSEGKVLVEVRDLLRVTEEIILYSLITAKEAEPEAPAREEKVEIAASMLEEPKKS
jgi:small subunit ribosomal protein S6